MPPAPARGRAASLALPAAVALLSSALLILDVAPATGPAALGGVAVAAMGTTCHQRPERSLAIGGVPLASCARCTGLHAGGLAAAGLAAAVGIAALERRRRALGVLAAAAGLLLVADVAAGIVTAWDVPSLRFVLGAAASTALLAWGFARARSHFAGQLTTWRRAWGRA